MRSDGSGITWNETSPGGSRNGTRKLSWSVANGNLTIGIWGDFKPEGDDLIDSAGNRWQRR